MLLSYELGLRFHFYSRENHQRPHIHVARGDYEAKFCSRGELWIRRTRVSR
ncbi:MAG: hypothetical protein DME49_00735 [Verrucomicrobia bacterium]|nr:MAG: hypothetical protein DME49_00735 [Verrucomicrobiota bacterium]PYL57722.1 MAG: hypothetical protein DMF30_05285 [Verrucomicrobiota bacterium]